MFRMIVRGCRVGKDSEGLRVERNPRGCRPLEDSQGLLCREGF